ncbi:MAG TPA: UDP-3-O-(3-hydroxymyristoyl)glucosamine N-acyltransferase [Phycisphaerales bacterium]|nr:UDP-3-O-(3-hydroxymyristoyl)glucosamine N-acyltransferase [Phycisphaerales bacterium]
MQTKTVREIADYVGGRVLGSESVAIRAASTLDNAGPGQITFLSNPKYTPKVQATQAAAVLVSMPVTTSAVQIITDDPYYAFMQVVVLLHGHREHPPVGVSDKADIAPSARLGQGTQAAAFVSIGENVTVGCNCYFYPGVSIGPNVQIGDDCIFYPNAVIYDGCRIGHRVIIQSNASVGQDGFGFATHKGVHHKIPQIGGVVLEDDVEIGAGCAIERGTLDDTVIGQGSKIGDAVAIGHGARIGPYCLLVPQVGISGSAILGHHCVLGGQAGVVGHIKIGNGVRIGAQAGVINDVPDGATLVGAPAIDAGKARRAYSLIEYLPELRKKIRDLERRMEKRDRGSDGN